MEKSILHNNLQVFYTSKGEGKPVVLLHGLAEDSRIWEGQVEFLSVSFLLIVPDLPGSGRSSLPDNVSMESLADTVKAILEAENIRQAVIIGHSMGGYVSLAFAERYPEMVAALGLFHSTAFADSDEKKAARKRNNEFITSHGTFELLKQATPPLFSHDSKNARPEMVEELIDRYKDFNPLAIIAYNSAMLQRPDRTRLLAGAAFPILFIVGRQDGTLSFHQSLQMSHMPDMAYIHVLERSGHMGLLEEADKSNLALRKFLEDVFID